MQRDDYILKLNDPSKKKRVKYAAKLGKLLKKEGERKTVYGCCGFLHSTYSFSPYSPSMAAYMAYRNGLPLAGLADTGTLAGGAEFLAAAQAFGVGGLVGVGYPTLIPKAYRSLCNVSSRDYSKFIYLAAFGIPENAYQKMDHFLAGYRGDRDRCNRRILAQINARFRGLGHLSYEEDVLPVTRAEDGGSITRSHVMLALSKRLMKMVGVGAPLVDYLVKVQEISLNSREENLLLAPEGPNYVYDLSSILYKKLKVDDEEYVSRIHKFISATLSSGGLVFYPISEKDASEGGARYIDDMLANLKQLNVHGVAYSAAALGESLSYLESRCKAEGLLCIDGNTVQSARDMIAAGDMSSYQETCFYALIGNAYLAGKDPMDAFFGPRTERRLADVSQRLQVFSEVGKKAVSDYK